MKLECEGYCVCELDGKVLCLDVGVCLGGVFVDVFGE